MIQVDARTRASAIKLARAASVTLFVAAALAVVAPAAFAAETPEIIVEAAAPVKATAVARSSSGVSTEILSVRYRVRLAGLDLTRHADVEKLTQMIHDAAAQGCKHIKEQYPLRPMTDDATCISNASESAMATARVAIADAEKRAGH